MNTTQLWTNIIAYLLQVGLVVGIGAALPVLLRLKAPGARLLYWQVLLVACLALPWVRPWQTEVIAIANVPFAVTQTVLPVVAVAPARFSLPPVAEIALWFLAAGVIVRLAWLAIGLLKLARYRRHGHAIPLPPEWNGAARRARLRVSDEISGPVTFGFFRPVVLLPASFPSMSEPMRNAILFHELIHVERRDWLFTLGEELARAVFWFHPAIWWVLGEIQLAREQTVDRAVIEMTQARDPYVDTLLAMAGVNPQMDLAPAPLFLRRRHLKQRVMGLVQEVGMSKTRMMFAQIAALTAMGVACWFVTGAIPLHAQAQLSPDGRGVTVNLNGSQLMHRSPVAYPGDAWAKGIEGTVVVQVRLDTNGEVIDDAILSGPDELRKGVQQAVLSWHFDKAAGGATRVVNIDFAKPANGGDLPIPSAVVRPQIVVGTPVPGGRGGAVTAPSPAQRQSDQDAVTGLVSDMLRQAEKEQAQAPSPAGAAQVEDLRKKLQIAQANGQTAQQYQFMQNQMASLQQRVAQTHDPSDVALLEQLNKKVEDFKAANAGRIPQSAPDGTIERIEVTGLSDTAKAQLLSQLPIHAGEPHSMENMTRIREAVRDFDVHLSVSGSSTGSSGVWTLRIETPEAHSFVNNAVSTPPAGTVTIAGNAAAANLISAPRPVYPPLAKMARQQGTVKFQATIGADGRMENLILVSGPPLLVPAAMEAVKTWIYRPTLVNGVATPVSTMIDVNFSLQGDPSDPPAQ